VTYRILEGDEYINEADRPYIADATSAWRWDGCTCEPLGWRATELVDGSLFVKAVHDERCPHALNEGVIRKMARP